MKSVRDLTDELVNDMPLSTSLERTRLLVFIDDLYDNLYRDHRLELSMYSIRFKANDNEIYVYGKKEKIDVANIEYLDNVEITNDYKCKAIIRNNVLNIDKEAKCRLLRLFVKLRILKRTAQRKLDSIDL